MKPEEFDEHVASYTSQSLERLVSRCFLVDTNLSVESLGFKTDIMESPITGAEGNKEFLLYAHWSL